MKRALACFAVVSLISSFGCKKKPPPPEPKDAPPPVVAATASAAAPTKPAPPPPFVAPAALPRDDVYLLGGKSGSTIRIDARGAMKRDDKLSLLDVTRGKDGAVYGTTTTDLRKAAGGGWKVARKYGDKASLALIMGDSATLRVIGGVRGPRVALLTDKESWTGPIDDNVMVGGPLSALYRPVLDASGRTWGTSVDDKLLTEKGSEFEKVAWAPSATVLVVPRAHEGVFAIAKDTVVIGAPDKDPVRVPLAFEVQPTTKAAAGANDTLVLKTPESLVFVSPSGGASTVKAKASDVFAVDGRSRVWTVDGDELRVIGPDGSIVATKKLPATMKPASITRIVPLGGGADLK